MSKALPKRSENYSEWYNEIVKRADLAENSAVRGCMVIKPYGYAIWEKMQRALDDMFKATGHVNAYFPLFVPKSFLEKEEEHAEGFAKECAVVTHYRLKANPDGKGLVVDPNAKLEEELIIRPTSDARVLKRPTPVGHRGRRRTEKWARQNSTQERLIGRLGILREGLARSAL